MGRLVASGDSLPSLRSTLDATSTRHSHQTIGSHVIITFRLSAKEFEEHLSHRQSCTLCDELAHLYMDIAELAQVRVVINDLDDQPDRAILVRQLCRLQAKIKRRYRRYAGVDHGRRLSHDVERDQQERALKLIRHAWDRQEEQELQDS